MVDAGLANVAVSLDGPEALHDTVRGDGNYREPWPGSRRWLRRGCPSAVLTTSIVAPWERLEEITDLAVTLGPRTWRVQLGKPMGNLASHREHLLGPVTCCRFRPRMARLKQRSSIWVDVGDSVGYYGPHEAGAAPEAWGSMQDLWSGCQAGRFSDRHRERRWGKGACRCRRRSTVSTTRTRFARATCAVAPVRHLGSIRPPSPTTGSRVWRTSPAPAAAAPTPASAAGAPSAWPRPSRAAQPDLLLLPGAAGGGRGGPRLRPSSATASRGADGARSARGRLHRGQRPTARRGGGVRRGDGDRPPAG